MFELIDNVPDSAIIKVVGVGGGGGNAVNNMIAIDVPIYLKSNYYAWGEGNQFYSDIEALKGITIAASRSSAFAKDLAAKGYSVIFVANEETALKMVMSERAQVATFSDYSFNTFKEAGQAGRLKAVSEPLHAEWLYHHVHNRHADLVPALENAIKTLKGQGLFLLR